MYYLFSLLIAGFVCLGIDTSKLGEESVGVQINNSEDLTIIQPEKSLLIAGESFPGYNSKLSVKGAKTALKIKKGSKLVFYVRGSLTYKQTMGLPLSIVKMEVHKSKRVAHSKEGMTKYKDIEIESLPYYAKEIDAQKRIYRVQLKEEPAVGVWCVNFHHVINGRFPIGSGYGKYSFCFEIIE